VSLRNEWRAVTAIERFQLGARKSALGGARRSARRSSLPLLTCSTFVELYVEDDHGEEIIVVDMNALW